MKRFKKIDLWLSILLIAGFIIAYLVDQRPEVILTGYFTVGGWQVISMLMHAMQGWFTEKGGARVWYHWITFFSVITMPMGSFWILAITAPFMAVYYTWICWREIYIKMRRPITLLK